MLSGLPDRNDRNGQEARPVSRVLIVIVTTIKRRDCNEYPDCSGPVVVIVLVVMIVMIGL